MSRSAKILLILLAAGLLCFGALEGAVLAGCHDEVTHDADVVIVLGAKLWPDGPSPALKRRLDKAADSTDEDGLLCDLLDEAEAFVKGYTRRRAVPEALAPLVCELAAGSYQRLGLEGQQSHTEGGVTLTLESLSDRQRRQLEAYRLAIVG